MNIETWPIDKPVDYPNNARKWPPRAVAKVGASIKEYGWRQPIVVDKAGVIVIGHLRRLAGRTIGLKECPVHVAADLTPAQIRGLRLADNRTNQESDWDIDLLGPELLELKAEGFDLTLTGFDSREIDGFTLKGNAAEDEVPPVPETPISKLGDLWLCGPHRVLCGNATSQSDVTILLAGVTQPFLMVTDPPYGVELDTEWRNKAVEEGHIHSRQRRTDYMAGKNDTEFAWKAAHELFKGDVAYVWCASKFLAEVGMILTELGFERRALIIWKKPGFAISRGHYHWSHEPCWYTVRKGSAAHWTGDRSQNTVWEVTLNAGNDSQTKHVAQKPVEIMRRPLLNHTKPKESVYDPFLGSGTTLVAAETTERVCYGLELEPRFVDVIVQRWQKLSGKQATLQTSGRTFEQEAKERGQANRNRIQANG